MEGHNKANQDNKPLKRPVKQNYIGTVKNEVKLRDQNPTTL